MYISVFSLIFKKIIFSATGVCGGDSFPVIYSVGLEVELTVS